MQPNYQNYAIDMLILVSFLVCAVTGFIKWPGFLGSLGLSSMVLPMRQITTLHDWSGLLMVTLIAVHFILHLGWLIAMTKRVLGISGRTSKKA
jgi:hypothetical protein